MDRIFQHYEGEIDTLKGARFTTVKSLVDDANDVVLLGLNDEVSNCWYRIFIDGTYCGVDRYIEDASVEDDDDDVSWQDHSYWFVGMELSNAKVSLTGKEGDSIVLSMYFGESEFKLICKFEVDKCRLEFA